MEGMEGQSESKKCTSDAAFQEHLQQAKGANFKVLHGFNVPVSGLNEFKRGL